MATTETTTETTTDIQADRHIHTVPPGTQPETHTCEDCDGTGSTEEAFFGGYGECGACLGEGEIDGYVCLTCGADETESCECAEAAHAARAA